VSHSVKLIVAAYVSLKDRQAIEDLREHRQVLRKKLQDINGMDVSKAGKEPDPHESQRLMSIVEYWKRLADLDDWERDGFPPSFREIAPAAFLESWGGRFVLRADGSVAAIQNQDQVIARATKPEQSMTRPAMVTARKL